MTVLIEATLKTFHILGMVIGMHRMVTEKQTYFKTQKQQDSKTFFLQDTGSKNLSL